jgi:hypothetical protein
VLILEDLWPLDSGRLEIVDTKMLMPSIPNIGKVKIKQLLWPALWTTLLLWLLVDAFKASPADTIATSTTNSSSFSLSKKIQDVFTSPKNSTAKETTSVRFSDGPTANISSSNKVAVIIETRASGGIIPLVLHFATVLGPDWPVLIYTPTENFGSFSTSHSLVRFIKAGRVVVRPLADGIYFPSWDSVSEFLTQKWMWEDLAPAEHIFIFQGDSIICANSVRSVEDFFEWDLIGAPIDPKYGVGYNGGLSLRKRSSMLRVLDTFNWHDATGPEDQWFFAR